MNTTPDDLKYGVEYWEKLLTDMDDLKERLKEHKAALKAKGYNVKMVGQLVAIRRKDKSDEASQDINDLLLYAAATGTNLNVIAELEPTPIEAAIQASKAKDATVNDPDTGEVIDVAELADKLVDYARAGDPRALSVIAAAKVSADAMAGVAGVMAGHPSYTVGGRA
jgi:uncharacterized protein (UPF0335 family)